MICNSGARQNLGSKEFKNKIFETKNLPLATCAGRVIFYLTSSIAIASDIL
jgi:hypothetical protein